MLNLTKYAGDQIHPAELQKIGIGFVVPPGRGLITLLRKWVGIKWEKRPFVVEKARSIAI